MASKVFWLSFCDNTRPKGSQFLGAAIVEVSDADAEAALDVIRQRFPKALAGAEWIGAASRKAWALGCNPGGEMATAELDADNPNLTRYPRGVLLSREQLETLDTLVPMLP